MKFRKSILASVAAIFMLTACAEQGGTLTKQQAGTGLGAVGGALAGSQVGKGDGRIVGAVVGALVGSAIGSSVGASLDRIDQQYYANTQQRALESYRVGQTASWKNPDSGNSGTITPTRTYTEGNLHCREFTQVIMIGGKKQEGYGTACRMADGSWEIRS